MIFGGRSKFIVALLLILLIVLAPLDIRASSANPNEFQAANAAISAAYSATYSAGQSGGEVSALVAELNNALALVQKAQSENASNPSQATTDLQTAVQIAHQVSTQALSIGQSGAAARQNVVSESIGGLIAIAIIGIFVYVYGGRAYRMIWLLVYRERVVRREIG